MLIGCGVMKKKPGERERLRVERKKKKKIMFCCVTVERRFRI
jgi:hypothetical protein